MSETKRLPFIHYVFVMKSIIKNSSIHIFSEQLNPKVNIYLVLEMQLQWNSKDTLPHDLWHDTPY